MQVSQNTVGYLTNPKVWKYCQKVSLKLDPVSINLFFDKFLHVDNTFWLHIAFASPLSIL